MSTHQLPAPGATRRAVCPSAQLTVLHVDDDPEFPELLAEFVETEDIAVVPAHDAAEGLSRLDADDATFDCIVTDCEMPGMDGLEFAREVRRRGIDLPLIMFSWSARDRPAEAIETAGLTARISKGGPEQFHELIRRLEQVADPGGDV